jgi:aminoglycoside phosphotransferase (APT) family kinase protein
MSNSKSPEGQIHIELPVAVHLVGTQFPQWGHLPIVPIKSAGTHNALFKLGEDMVVRIPRATWATQQVQKEQEWLPRLAPDLPLVVPVPLVHGKPDEIYPWAWSVYRWIEGEDLHTARIDDPLQMARDLAAFIKALQRLDSTGGPRSSRHNNYRGVPLAMLDDTVRKSLAQLEGLIDTSAASHAWERALDVAVFEGAPVWVHGDLQAGNLLARNGRLSSVIDFGLLGVGDPACDLIVAWNLLDARSREVFRGELGVDEASWARGRGWALYTGLVALPYYLNTNSVIVKTSRHVLSEVLGDQSSLKG